MKKNYFIFIIIGFISTQLLAQEIDNVSESMKNPVLLKINNKILNNKALTRTDYENIDKNISDPESFKIIKNLINKNDSFENNYLVLRLRNFNTDENLNLLNQMLVNDSKYDFAYNSRPAVLKVLHQLSHEKKWDVYLTASQNKDLFIKEAVLDAMLKYNYNTKAISVLKNLKFELDPYSGYATTKKYLKAISIHKSTEWKNYLSKMIQSKQSIPDEVRISFIDALVVQPYVSKTEIADLYSLKLSLLHWNFRRSINENNQFENQKIKDVFDNISNDNHNFYKKISSIIFCKDIFN